MAAIATKRRILFLLPFAPRRDAAHGGGRAMAELLAGLATRHELALLYLHSHGDPPLDEMLQERCDLAEGIERPFTGQSNLGSWLRRGQLATSLMLQRPMWVSDWASTAYSRRLRRLVQTWRPDLVQIEYHIMAQYSRNLDACPAPRLLVEHEPGIQAAPYLSAIQGQVGQWLAHLDRESWKKYERQAIKSVDAVVVFTERDRQVIGAIAPGARVARIPLGTPIPNQPLDPIGGPPLSLLFVGNFIHPPNVDAAVRLICNIFPSVQERFPEVRLYIVGGQPPKRICRLAGEAIIVTGRVPDLTPYLNQAALCLAPLRLGGGMRVKVLEALAFGKATVASRLAIEGLDLADGAQVILAESDREFSAAIIRLLGDPEKRNGLGMSARAWASRNLNWQASVTAYEDLYTSLIESPSREVAALWASNTQR